MADEPLRITTFTLTRADALAYEQAAGHLSPLGLVSLLLWLGFCGALAWLIPADWAGQKIGWSFSILVSILIAIGYVLVLIGLSFRQWLAAGRRIRRPLEMTLSEWPDRFDIVAAGLPRELKFGDIRESILGQTHLFLVDDEGVLILPRSAFPEEDVIEHLAARIAGTAPPAPAKPESGA